MITTSNGMIPGTGPRSEPVSYEAGRLRDADESVRDRAAANSWRRAFSVTALGLVGSLAVVGILASHNQHDVLVYRETSRGLSYSGEAQQSLAPDELAIESQIGAFVRAYRDVPGPDFALVDRNVALVLMMTADAPDAHASAHSDALAYFRDDANNPKKLGTSLTRTVLDPVVASPIIGTNTWTVTWVEETNKGGAKSRRLLSGTVTIAPNPRIPTDRQLAALNPAGVIVIESALHV